MFSVPMTEVLYSRVDYPFEHSSQEVLHSVHQFLLFKNFGMPHIFVYTCREPLGFIIRVFLGEYLSQFHPLCLLCIVVFSGHTCNIVYLWLKNGSDIGSVLQKRRSQVFQHLGELLPPGAAGRHTVAPSEAKYCERCHQHRPPPWS